MKKFSKFFTMLLVAVLIISNNSLVYASNETTVDNEIVSMNVKNVDFQYLDMETCNYVDVIKIDSISNILEPAKELLDNGTSLYVTDDNPKEILEIFDGNTSNFEDADVYLGTYIQSYGDDYMVTPVVADIVDLEDVEIEPTMLNENLDMHDMYNDIQNDISDLEFFANISDEQKIKLQTSTAIGSSFKGASLFTYFYKKGIAGGTGTDYKYSKSNALTDWSKLGSIKILGYAIKVKTVGTKTYDNVYSIVTASGLNDKYVKYYTYNMEVTSSNTDILDETYLTGDTNSTVTTSIGNGISSDGKSTITATTSYSYNPRGQTINNQIGERYIKTWKSTPNDFVENESWKIQPSILVVNSSGTTTKTTVKLYVSSFRVSGGTRTYTINDEAAVTLSFKNHS